MCPMCSQCALKKWQLCLLPVCYHFTPDVGCLQVAFVKYRLPAIACQPPLLLCLSLMAPAAPAGQPRQLLLSVQFAVSPVLKAPFRHAVLDLDIPAALGQPQQVPSLCSFVCRFTAVCLIVPGFCACCGDACHQTTYCW